MGGVLILGSFVIAVGLWGNWNATCVWISALAFLAFGALGALDDRRKLLKGNSKGLSGREKLMLQMVVSVFFVGLVMWVNPSEMQTSIFLPVFKKWVLPLGVLMYGLFGSFMLVGTSNAVNLTDGLDGLATGPVIISCGVLGLAAYMVGHVGFSAYLHLPHVPSAGELSVLCGAVMGGSLGFLWFNAYPAKIFMGDTGSMALGGFLAILSILAKQELLLGIVGGIFVLEAVSVIVQVAVFKRTGKRVFLMAPIHHHFEGLGWSESQIVFRFWIISFFLGLLALVTLKLR